MSEKNIKPVWRESASLIICARSPSKSDGYDYETLMLKRSDRTALINNQGVFPGGIYDPFDESIQWMQYFKDFGVTQQSLKELVLVDITERPKILASQDAGCYDRFFKNSKIWAREISLRINAIRETFEEVGILLSRRHDQLNLPTAEVFNVKDFDTAKWQNAVHNDPRMFLQLCRELNVVPDLWSLHEWSCWASPAVIKRGYETAFFITFLPDKPKVLCEESEVKEHLWLSPSAILEMVRNMDLFFLPPQFYEISRLAPYKSYEYLKEFANQRSKKGMTTHHPIAYFCIDGTVGVLPGDDYYAGCPRLATTSRSVEFTVDEFRAQSKRYHRLEHPGSPNAVLRLNVELLDGNLRPLCEYVDKNKL